MTSLHNAPKEIAAGFLPLLDCALLVVAREKGFARAEGLDLHLVREQSWASVRDRLAIGGIHAAQLPAPLPIATTLGLGSLAVDMIAPMALGSGGNAITVSAALAQDMSRFVTLNGDPVMAGRALRLVLNERKAAGLPQIVFAVVHPYSSHNYELRYWLAASGVSPDQDVQITVLPPPFLPDALAVAHIDGYCVGEPWNTAAVERGLGAIVTTKSRIWPASLEKVLAMRTATGEREPETVMRLVRALAQASAWCGAAENTENLADLLGRPEYLNAPASRLLPGLTGRIAFADGVPSHDPDFLVFQRGDAVVPWTGQALWLYAQMVRWGHARYDAESLSRAAGVFRPDLYRRALGEPEAPEAYAPERFFDGGAFSPAQAEAYLAEVSPIPAA
ncbi:MAG: putative nitrate transporter component, nrtA [Hyphomicrobiales bacterium]|nr:putative nitrate transporter component, nrtA [Hyphomicrobiales bacterium]